MLKTFFPQFIKLSKILFISSIIFTGCSQDNNLQNIVTSVPKTKGGVEGKVIKVSNLMSSGQGSLREAINYKGAKVIVFEVGGTIDLNGESLEINEPYLTLAGETAPSPGITLIKGGIIVKTHDIHISHLRVRPGDFGQKKLSGWQPDGINVYGENAYNIVIKNCSISWAVDENLSASGSAIGKTSHNILFKNNIIAEGLFNSSHKKGPHSMGTLVHNNVKNVLIEGNLYAHNNQRNPRLKQGAGATILNNIVYNPGTSIVELGSSMSDKLKYDYFLMPTRALVLGNIFIPGINTPSKSFFIKGRGVLYQKNNRLFSQNHSELLTDLTNIDIFNQALARKPNLNNHQSTLSFYDIINNVGARPWDKDLVDERLLNTLCKKTGRIIDSQDEVGGYPIIKETYKKLQVPRSNISKWLDLFIEPRGRNLDKFNCEV